MIYLAGSCASEQRTLMTKIAKTLRDNDYDVYCPFELKIPNAWDISQEEWGQKVFESDIAALDKADIFLMITPGRIGSAGTNWEQGYAYAKGKKVIVFQVTEAHTSLMTYAGSTMFLNTTVDSVCKDVIEVLDNYEIFARQPKRNCKTILT